MIDGATHYHADYVKPSWRHDMTMVSKIDDLTTTLGLTLTIYDK